MSDRPLTGTAVPTSSDRVWGESCQSAFCLKTIDPIVRRHGALAALRAEIATKKFKDAPSDRRA